MDFVDDFVELSPLYTGAHSRVFRALRASDSRPVVLKTLHPHPTREHLARFQLEVDLTHRVAGPGVIAALGTTEFQGIPALILEDYGDSLAERLKQGPLPLADVLDIGIQIARALHQAHDKQVLHKDVNPANIVWDATHREARLIDFGIASALASERADRVQPGTLEGTLHYLSPEQTGRTNRAIDPRSDLYSLGATLYALVAGRPPFEGDDPLALIHAHIARTPKPLTTRATVPQVLSDIVDRCLKKSAESRYQSALGLAADLEKLQRALDAGEQSPSFPLGEDDRSGELRLPQQLYGREEELAVLREQLESAFQGGARLCMVHGYSGIGKTALVRELDRDVAARNGLLLAGKYDQFQRATPFAALIEALRRFLSAQLAEDDRHVSYWRERLHEAVAPHGGVLTPLLPELELLLGAQPEPAVLPPSESDQRLRFAFTRMLRAIPTPERPVLLFLDDLQWADLATLGLLRQLQDDRDTPLLILGAYRSNEVDDAHPLALLLDDLTRLGQPVAQLALGPLGVETLTLWLTDALGRDDVEPLAQVVHDKTGGNPFFTARFLLHLASLGHIAFESPKWVWKLDAIAAVGQTENVVEFLAGQLHQLPQPSQDLLQLAALYGGEVSLQQLANTAQTSADAAAEALWPALREGLLVAARGRWEPQQPDAAVRFVHDRVQQAALSSITDADRPALRLRIARQLDASDHDLLFARIDHLNAAETLLSAPAERLQLARDNAECGRRASQAAAHHRAQDYFRAAADLWPARWDEDPEWARKLALDHAQTAYLAGDFAQTDAVLDSLATKDQSPLTRALAAEIRVNAQIAQNDLEAAIALAVENLAPLGVSLPLHPNQGHVVAGLLRTKWALRGKSDADLLARPDVEDPLVRATRALLLSIISATYYARPTLMPLLAFTLVRDAVERGISHESCFAFSVWSLVHFSLGDLEGGIRWRDLSRTLRDRSNDTRLSNRTLHVCGAHLDFWTQPYAEDAALLRQTFQTGLMAGDVEYGSFSAMMSCAIGMVVAEDLEDLAETMKAFAQSISSLAQETVLYTHQMNRQLVLNLLDPDNSEPWRLYGPVYDERVSEPVHLEAEDQSNLWVLNHRRLWGSVLMNRPELGDAAIAANNQHMDASACTVFQQTYIWLRGLQPLLCGRNTFSSRRGANSALKTLRSWAERVPENHQHRIALLEAELARVQGDEATAGRRYEAAIFSAQATGVRGEHAFACERAGRFYQARGSITAARSYLADARNLYLRWGAQAKVRQLDDEFPGLAMDQRAFQPAGPMTLTRQTPNSSDLIDNVAVMRAAEALATEIDLSALVEKLLGLAVEVGGAQRGVLLIERQESLIVTAEATADEDITVQPVDQPTDTYSALPMRLVRFAWRSAKPLVVADTDRDPRASTDPWVQQSGARSVLLIPVLLQGRPVGLLVLEHQTARVFTADRVELLRVLLGQAAVSLENARLYADLQELARAQARFVPTPFLQNLNRSSIRDIGLGEQTRKQMTVLFSDIRGFTPLMERLDPDEHIAFINRYLSRMEPSILANGGFVDSYIGDAVMALFDSPSGGSDEAIAAGVGMFAALDAFNADRVARGDDPIQMGVGLHSGTLTLGTIGGPERIKCGVIGSPVNLAARVESLTKTYDTRLMVSDLLLATLARPQRWTLRPVDRVTAKGSAIPITMYEVLEADPPDVQRDKRRSLERFVQGFAAYLDARFEPAIEAFQACLDEWPADQGAQRFLTRCQQLAAAGVPDDWTGVWALDHK